MYLQSDAFFRMPDTFNRVSIFVLSLVFLVMSSLYNPPFKSHNRLITILFITLSSLFFTTIIITNNIYNLSIILLIIISIYYYIYKADNHFKSIEITFLLSYLAFFTFPFIHSYFITTTITEADNYTRFLLAIPLYLMIRDLDFDKQFFLYLINIASIILLPVTLYFYLVYDIDRIRIFTSSATVFSNISMTFFLFSLLSIYFFKKYKIDYIFLAYLGSFAAFFAWGLSGSRFTIIIPLIVIILLILIPNYRKYGIPLCNKLGLLFIGILLSVFLTSTSFDRLTNLNLSSIGDYSKPEANHWIKRDSIVPRLLIWNGAINIINENTFTGIGLDNFNRELHSQIINNKIQPIRKDFDNPTAGLNHAHSQFLDTFAKLGLFGFLLLSFFIIINFYFFYRLSKNNEDNVFAIFGLLFILIHSLIMINHVILSHHQSTIFMVFLLVFFAGLSLNNYKKGEKR